MIEKFGQTIDCNYFDQNNWLKNKNKIKQTNKQTNKQRNKQKTKLHFCTKLAVIFVFVVV